MTRNDVLEEAISKCMKELYSKAQPSINWDDFIQQNKDYSIKYNDWKDKVNKGENLDLLSYCGPRPYEFYYLPKEVMKDICDSYIHAYRLDSQQELLDTIDTLKEYCDRPIVDKWIEDKDGDGHRGYDRPDSLYVEIAQLLGTYCDDSEAVCGYVAGKIKDLVFKFLDMAGNFYNWNYDLNYFNTNVYLGASPNSNKEKVIENWKLYRNKIISIDESVYIEDEEY